VEAAIKFSRAHTRRNGLLYADGAFHGLTCGALSLMGDPFWRERFGPLLPDTEAVPFGNLAVLEEKLASKRFAAFIVEPLQGEGGVRVLLRRLTWRASRPSVGVTERCSSSMRCRPVYTAPAASWRRIITISSRT
jgi:4-aminobutyrate aminotransferase-like enzyme